MFATRFVRILAIFTALSVGLGVATRLSPAVAAFGWAIGTLLSICAGVAYGQGAADRRDAAVGGALAGGLSIALGCLLAFALRSLPLAGVVAASVVGFASGGAAALVAHAATARPARATSG